MPGYNPYEYHRLADMLDASIARINDAHTEYRRACIEKMVDLEDSDSLLGFQWLIWVGEQEEERHNKLCDLIPEWFWERSEEEAQARAERLCPEC